MLLFTLPFFVKQPNDLFAFFNPTSVEFPRVKSLIFRIDRSVKREVEDPPWHDRYEWKSEAAGTM